MKRVGFIGVGNIGTPMAMCLVRAGLDVIVCDKRQAALEPFTTCGVSATQNSAECALRDMVVIMVADDAQVEEAILGSNGLMEAIDRQRPPLVAIMSTVLPTTVQKLSSLCLEKNVHVIDAPVSGGPVVAEQGKLTIMVGGENADVEAMRPVLEIMGSNIYHTGELGSGNITKLVNNIIGITSFFVSTEALTIAQKLGMQPHTLASILENSTGRNFLTKDWESGRKIFASFSQTLDSCKTAVNLSRKDLDYARQLAAKLELPSTFLHSIIDGITRVSYEEIHEKWQSLTQWQSPADEQEG